MSIYKRKGSPHWWISISVAGTKTRRTTGTADRGQAKEFEAAERERLWRLYKLGDRGALRWTEAASQWLNDLNPKSRPKEESILNWFDLQIRDESISSIDREAVLELRQSLLSEGKSKARTDRYLAILRAVLRKAQMNGHLTDVPVVAMFNAGSAGLRWLNGIERERLYRSLPRHLELAARFAVETGLRMRAQSYLTWDRVDLRHRRAWIPAVQMKGGRDFGFPLNREAIKLLRQLKTMYPKGMRIFQYNDMPIDDFNTRAFKKAVTAAKLEPLRWHDLRHTFAARAVQAGVTLHELMQLGDWRSYSMVLRYAHLAPEHLAQAAEKWGRSGHSKRKAKS